jgi:2-haloacid dehalogenase
MKPVIVFDLIGTLLDLAALDPLFERAFEDPKLRKEWFSEVFKIALATTAMNAYVDFSRITEAAMKVIEERYQRTLTGEQRQQILQALKELPAFPDVSDNLASLRNAGFRIVVLTNSKSEAAEHVLKHAGIRQYFDSVLSADSVRRLKPAPELYRMAASELGMGIESILLVAAHSWDVAGAIRAGAEGCFLRRPGQVLDETAPRPALIACDMQDFSVQLLHLESAA